MTIREQVAILSTKIEGIPEILTKRTEQITELVIAVNSVRNEIQLIHTKLDDNDVAIQNLTKKITNGLTTDCRINTEFRINFKKNLIKWVIPIWVAVLSLIVSLILLKSGVK